MTSPQPCDFISRWSASSAAERANYQLFLSELCDFLDRPSPQSHPSLRDRGKPYVFERSRHLRQPDGTHQFRLIDLYKRNHFVLEAKQGSPPPDGRSILEFAYPFVPTLRRRRVRRRSRHSGWDEAMLRARNQAEQYAKALPAIRRLAALPDHRRCRLLHRTLRRFLRHRQSLRPFPGSLTHRILLEDSKPVHPRPPSRHLARPLLARPQPHLRPGHPRRRLATRQPRPRSRARQPPARGCRRLPDALHLHFLRRRHPSPSRPQLGSTCSKPSDDLANFKPMVEALWPTMNTGGFSPILREHVLRFNGGLFEAVEALPLNRDQFDLLIEAAAADGKMSSPPSSAPFWNAPSTRASATPAPITRRAPTWSASSSPPSSSLSATMARRPSRRRSPWNAPANDDAIESSSAFQRRLCDIRVLDPACGSGNFLYVTLEHLKRLEGEVLEALEAWAKCSRPRKNRLHRRSPPAPRHRSQSRAAAITDLVLWIGYLQWHFRTRATAHAAQPVIKQLPQHRDRDALLA